FSLGTATRLLPAQHAAAALTRHEVAGALVERRQAQAFREAMARLGVTPRATGMAGGLDYSTGKPVALTLFRAE
ncbi:MAG: hypothetical protein ACREFC_02115, partial [Stellaceae bacterium]